MPSESHQFPVAVVVAAVVVGPVVVDGIVVLDVVVVVMEAVVDVDVEVVDVLQDVSSKVATSKKLKLNQINLFFTIYS